MPKIILDLCGGSGAWSKPYLEAGYDVRLVTLPESDVCLFKKPDFKVHGILAAPPCTEFSMARNMHPEKPRDFKAGLQVVDACMRIVVVCRPYWWALENPAGYLSKFLGKPKMVFQPWEFGDPYTKKTCIWGHFNPPGKWFPVKPSGQLDSLSKGFPRAERAARRAVTPAGFSKVFFEANP